MCSKSWKPNVTFLWYSWKSRMRKVWDPFRFFFPLDSFSAHARSQLPPHWLNRIYIPKLTGTFGDSDRLGSWRLVDPALTSLTARWAREREREREWVGQIDSVLPPWGHILIHSKAAIVLQTGFVHLFSLFIHSCEKSLKENPEITKVPQLI